MVASGIPVSSPDSCALLGLLALRMRARLRDGFSGPGGRPLEALMGIHSGPVIGGVIGYKLPRFRLFGDTGESLPPACARSLTLAPGGCLAPFSYRPSSLSPRPTVNTSARMQTHSLPGEIGLSEAAADRIRASVSREQGRSSASFDSLDIRRVSGPCHPVAENEESASSRGGSSRGGERYQHLALIDRGFKEVKSKGLVHLFFLREEFEALETQARQ